MLLSKYQCGLACIALFALSLLFAGCNSNAGKPEDMPKLIPCKITVTQDGKPLEGATVTLQSEDRSSKYGVAGNTTDAQGVAEIWTYGFSGVPVGKYAVTITKLTQEGGIEKTDASGAVSKTGAKEYSLVEMKYTKENTTPEKFEVTDVKNLEHKIDVGKAVHVYVSTSP